MRNVVRELCVFIDKELKKMYAFVLDGVYYGMEGCERLRRKDLSGTISHKLHTPLFTNVS